MAKKSAKGANITNRGNKKEILLGYDEETRPWGKFFRFTHNQPSTVKMITINPHHRNSMQRHARRTELWLVASGNPIISIGDNPDSAKEYKARSGDQFLVECGQWHRFSGGDTGASIIEISLGYFDEQDIERVDDDYGRVNQ